MESVEATLEESLRLDNEMKHKIEMLGDFANRVAHIRDAKAINEQHIATLEQQIAYLKGMLDFRQIQQPPREPPQAPPMTDFHQLAAILNEASGRVSIVGKTRDEVLAELTSRFGRERT
jgi:hypothetical protein